MVGIDNNKIKYTINMKRNKIYVLAILLLSFGFVGCEKFDFEAEQYKNVVYLLSDNDEFNMYNRAIADLNNDVDTLFITVGLSGSVGAPNDIPVEITPYFVAGRVDEAIYETLDRERLFYRYNKSRFDIEFGKWTNFLPETHYSFLPENIVEGSTPGTMKLKTTIKQGDSKAVIPLLVKDVYTLSPDSLYFLDYKITNAGGVEVNPNKDDALIPIYWKNYWTDSRNPLSYDMIGEQFNWRLRTQIPQQGTSRAITGSPILYPVGKNKIRIPAGIESVEAKDGKTKREMIDANSIVLVVNDDNTVDFEPYKDIVLVEGVQPDDIFYDENHTNRFFTEKILTSSGIPKYFKTFTLHYRYRNFSHSPGYYTYCKITLRYEFQPDAQ